jgi:ABC-type phosphate transport system substrate-binding protein
MRFINKKAGIAALLAGAALASFAVSGGSANADTSAPRAGDVAGVGSDTIQNAADFLFDGAPGTSGGYNTLGNNHRVFSFDATGDANGRATYDGTCGAANANTGLGTFCDSTTNQTPNLLPGTVVLRNATKPVTRPNGSGAGVAALIADATGGTGYQGLPAGSIQFARMSRLPNSSEEGLCPTTGPCGGLHVYQAATDNLQIAVDAKGTDAPAGLSLAELAAIYSCNATTWGQVGVTGANASKKIDALIPQSGSGTRNFFVADLTAADPSFVLFGTGGANSCGIRTVEEHDPTGIYADPNPADAIEPFSTGKITLINSGYFLNAGYSGTLGNAYTPGNIKTLTGASPDGSTAYSSTRGLYFVIRQPDLSISTPFQAGTTANWATTLFAGATSLIARSTNAPLIAAAGFTAAYKDCGVNPTTC